MISAETAVELETILLRAEKILDAHTSGPRHDDLYEAVQAALFLIKRERVSNEMGRRREKPFDDGGSRQL